MFNLGRIRRVGLDSQRGGVPGSAGCGSDALTDPALLHCDLCVRKRPPIEKGSGQVICNSPGHGLAGDADGVGAGSATGTRRRSLRSGLVVGGSIALRGLLLM